MKTKLFKYNGGFYYLCDYDAAQEMEELGMFYKPSNFAVFVFDTYEERENFIEYAINNPKGIHHDNYEVVEFYSF